MLKELLEFVNESGPIIQLTDDVDIVQLGLQQFKNSLIYKAAVTLASRRTNASFIEFL